MPCDGIFRKNEDFSSNSGNFSEKETIFAVPLDSDADCPVFRKEQATLAQLVEQRIRNAQVEGSNPLSGSCYFPLRSPIMGDVGLRASHRCAAFPARQLRPSADADFLFPLRSKCFLLGLCPKPCHSVRPVQLHVFARANTRPGRSSDDDLLRSGSPGFPPLQEFRCPPHLPAHLSKDISGHLGCAQNGPSIHGKSTSRGDFHRWNSTRPMTLACSGTPSGMSCLAKKHGPAFCKQHQV